MPHAVRGSVHWYDFGPVIGNELSGRRPALIVSNTKLNRHLSSAIALPMSTATPAGRHLQNHVLVGAAESWASVRQIKSVDQRRLGAKMADAKELELERAVEILVARFAVDRSSPRTTQTRSDHPRIEQGTICEIPFRAQRGSIKPTLMLVLDYNRGNHLAVAVEVEQGRSAESPVRIPIRASGTTSPVSALVHRVKSIDVSVRTATKVGVVEDSSLEKVGRTLLSMMDH